MERSVWSGAAAGVDPGRLGEARTQVQNAVHWLARIANSYVAPEPDHRHLWLSFDPARRAFVTRPVGDGVTVELRLPGLEFQFREAGRPVPHILNVEGHTPAKVEAWVLVELLHRGIDRDRFSKALPYAPANLMSGDNVEYSPESLVREIEALSQWLASGERVVMRLARDLAPERAAEAQLLCWPDQLHVGVLLPPGLDGTAPATPLRIGMSTGDERYAEPYFFVAAQRGADIETPHPGAVLTASRIAADGLDEDQVVAALRAAVATTRRRLAN